MPTGIHAGREYKEGNSMSDTSKPSVWDRLLSHIGNAPDAGTPQDYTTITFETKADISQYIVDQVAVSVMERAKEADITFDIAVEAAKDMPVVKAFEAYLKDLALHGYLRKPSSRLATQPWPGTRKWLPARWSVIPTVWQAIFPTAWM